MALSDDEIARLERLLEDCETYEDKLSPWEKNFISDQRERYEQYGAAMTLTSPQWGVLTRIEEKVGS